MISNQNPEKMKLPGYILLREHMDKVVTAHRAVHEGIASHGQKEQEKRDQARRNDAMAAKLRPVDYGQQDAIPADSS